MGASSTQQVLGIIEQAKMMPAQVSGNIAMTPLVNPDAVGYREILSMDLALEMGDLDVTETGNVRFSGSTGVYFSRSGGDCYLPEMRLRGA